MPSFVVHGIVPLLLLLATRRLDARKIWLLWPLTFAPDLDSFFGHHRATLHNVWILLPFLAILLWHLRPATRNLQRVEWMGIALVYLGSHLLMDVFAGGAVLFYPVSTYNFCHLAAIDVVTATNELRPYFRPCSSDGIPTVAAVFPWLSVFEGAMLAFLLPAGAILGLLHLRRRLRHRSPDERIR